MATVITPWIGIIAKRLGPGDCSLSMTDSSTSEGCLRKSNFKEDRESPIQANIRLKVSRSEAKRPIKKTSKIIASGSLAVIFDFVFHYSLIPI